MIINREIAIKPMENGDCAKENLERFYLQNSFQNHLNGMFQIDDRNSQVGSNRYYKYHVTSQVIDYIDGMFTLPELYCIFNASNYELGGWHYSYTAMDEFKTCAIDFIEKYATGTDVTDDIENFKKKVSELNPVVLNVLNDSLYESDIFNEDYYDGYRYPKISADESACQREFDELVWTYYALDRIISVCDKNYRINDRVSILTNEGYDIKPCWVDSGGVKSVFYMYNKKEIRVQIAASKFKGSGNSKSKSALCVVIPYPDFLHRNRIKYLD